MEIPVKSIQNLWKCQVTNIMVHPPDDLNLRPFKVRGLMNSTLVGDWKSANGFRNLAFVLKRYKVYNMFFY